MSVSVPARDQWSRVAIMHLIDLYRQNPCLWNVRLVTYKDRNKRAAALEKICNEMEKIGVCLTVDDIKKKIDTLRSQHRRELRKKKKKTQKSGAGTEDIHTPTLWCFDSLSFLADGDDIRASTTNLDTIDSEATSEVLAHSDHEVSLLLLRILLSC